MKGGDIYIDVRANYSAMERDLVEAESKASQAAEQAAKQYESKFGAWLQKSGGAISKKIESFINPIQLMDRVADFAETAGEEGIGTALDNLAESTPVIGAAYRIGKAIGGALVNAFGAETEDQFAARVEAELEAAQKQADARRKIAQAQEAEARETFGLGQEAGGAQFELEMRRLEQAGEKERAIFLRGLREEEQLLNEMEIRVADAANEEQKRAIQALYDAKIQLNADETNRKLEDEKRAAQALLDAKLADEMKAAEEIAKAEADAAKKSASEREKVEKEAIQAAEKRDAERLKNLEEAARIEEERIASQGAGVTGFQTALGTFKFDAYPDSEKKRNDDRMVRALETLVSTGSSGAGGFV